MKRVRSMRRRNRELANEWKPSGTAGCSSYCGRNANYRVSTASICSIGSGRKGSPCGSGGHDVAPWEPGTDPRRGQGKCPLVDSLGQWHRVHVERHARLGAREQRCQALRNAGQPMQNGSMRASMAGCGTSFSTRACSSAPIMPGPGLRTGPMTTTGGVRIQHWATSPRRLMPLTLPQHAIGCATRTSPADRTLLYPRLTALNPPRLCSLLGESSVASQLTSTVHQP